ncbi:MAG: hypothetical protein QY323_04560 [Patescibacteria group bacterium]|nr:MAG: hypothetical protein QY323_04560 [Patescibacteria group bacterium]
MIRFITPTDFPGVVAAEGPVYDFERVLDSGFRMLRVFHDAIRARHPRARCTAIVPGGPRWPFYTSSVEMMMREEMRELKKEFDVAGDACTLDAWPYHAAFSPMGSESLLRRHGELTTPNGNNPSELDTAPQLAVMRSMIGADGVPEEGLLQMLEGIFNPSKKPRQEEKSDPPLQQALREEDHAFFRELWTPFAEEGVVLTYGGMVVQARFDHAAFGLGRGPLRIQVT